MTEEKNKLMQTGYAVKEVQYWHFSDNNLELLKQICEEYRKRFDVDEEDFYVINKEHSSSGDYRIMSFDGDNCWSEAFPVGYYLVQDGYHWYILSPVEFKKRYKTYDPTKHN
jgi:hypothetical protein